MSNAPSSQMTRATTQPGDERVSQTSELTNIDGVATELRSVLLLRPCSSVGLTR